MTSPRALVCCIAAIPLAAALSGCATSGSTSTKNFSGESQAVAQTVSNFASDAQSRNTTKLCESDLAGTLVAQLEAGGAKCKDVMTHQLPEVDDFTLTIESINIDGKMATARVKDVNSGKDHFDTLKLVKDGGEWKISGLANATGTTA